MQSPIFDSWEKQIVLVNDNLSKLDGFDVTKMARELPQYKQIFIIMMSMGITEEEIIHAFKVGIDDFLNRPFNLRVLQAYMERVIERFSDDDEPIL
ncbi:response regulator [Aerococcus agrisoli]|uniref:response regulator n=1 Tax=Aerococcus agrisoli TaxID=2487350 RepID=UPI002105D037|nr:response regulator [Aerococcus agrisoli]